MIHGSSVRVESASWQNLLAGSITDPRVLLTRLQLDPSLLPGALAADRDFRLRVPEPYLQRMQPGNPKDPLLLQVLPLAAELDEQPGYVPTDGESVKNQLNIQSE